MPVKKRRYHNKNILIATSAVFAIVVVGGFYYAKIYKSNNSSVPADQTSQLDGEINLSPPTEEEKLAADEAKQKIVSQEEQNSSNATESKQVTPVISSYGYIDNAIFVSAFIPGIYEEGGICTLSLSKGSTSITRQTSGTKDATTTRCQNFSVPYEEGLSSGAWSASISYSSATANGSSDTVNIEVNK